MVQLVPHEAQKKKKKRKMMTTVRVHRLQDGIIINPSTIAARNC
jgi:hypothetical protein